jgi:AraC-like DNA-binding protein
MNERLEEMCELVGQHCAAPRQPTAIPGLTLFQVAAPAHPTHLIYNPRILIILRGRKTVSLGGSPFEIDASTFLFVTVDLPVCTQISLPPDGKSHMALTLDVDRMLLAEVLQKLPFRVAPAAPPAGVIPGCMNDALLDPFARLLKLLDIPGEAEFLRPLILQEIYFRLFSSGVGDALAQLAMGGSHLSQISKATSWIKSHYSDQMSIEGLAGIAGMSVTSFHRHFKAVTLMTPLQYRMQIRLQEARRILLSERQTAGSVGLSVGYDSQSQFTRDYRRMFGAPPATCRAARRRSVRRHRAVSSEPGWPRE